MRPARGPEICGSQSVGEVRLLDLVPTWLDLLGIKVPDALEGASIGPALTNIAIQ